MRKTNKKHSGLLTKSGVILVTIIFIVALSLIFITTALMISIAGRQRVYTNAMNSQARLTVTSLSQTIWQAIYSQQITDAQLVELAKGTGSGSVVIFKTEDLPGMSLGGSECSAYFYCMGDENKPNKIGIECKCEINGIAEYYLLVLERNRGEDVPPASFNTLVELGDGGILNNVNFGVNVNYIEDNGRATQVSYDSPDNVIFLHAPDTSHSNVDGLGIYSTLITDGYLAYGDVVLARDVYFMGANAGFAFGANGNQNNPCTRTRTGAAVEDTTPAADRQYGNLYFWGTNSPFYNYNGGSPTAAVGTNAFTLYGINNMYFDLKPEDDGSRSGFGPTTFRQTFNGQFFDDNTVTGDVYYEDGITADRTGLGANDPSFHEESEGYAPVTSDMISYLTPGDYVDTVSEVADQMSAVAEAQDIIEINSEADLPTAFVGGKTYHINDNIGIDSVITCNLSSGNVYLVIAEDKCLYFKGNGSIQVSGGSDTSEFFIYLLDGATVKIGNDGSGNPSDGTLSGIVDTTVYTSAAYTDVTKLNQTKIPRTRILSTYTGGTQVSISGNHNCVLTCFLGLYSTTPGGAGGGVFSVHNAESHVYYGRIACGGIDCGNGNQFNIPYCPTPSITPPGRDTAYRDLTDFSVVSDECRYFTYG
ncbi:MAG: hypothetical protein K6F79_00920 [Saccharofermentans sp.]|nr:hypothetical protein [Saccharofermentans sp.]